jgi:hypothetical protein
MFHVERDGCSQLFLLWVEKTEFVWWGNFCCGEMREPDRCVTPVCSQVLLTDVPKLREIKLIFPGRFTNSQLPSPRWPLAAPRWSMVCLWTFVKK